MSGGIQRIAMDLLLLMTSEHPVLILMKMDSLTQLKMGIGITFVDGLINPVQ